MVMVMVTLPVSPKPVSVSGIKARNSRRGSEIKDISLSVQTAPGEWGHCRIACITLDISINFTGIVDFVTVIIWFFFHFKCNVRLYEACILACNAVELPSNLHLTYNTMLLLCFQVYRVIPSLKSAGRSFCESVPKPRKLENTPKWSTSMEQLFRTLSTSMQFSKWVQVEMWSH